MLENAIVTDAGRVECRPERLRAWAQTLRPDDEVALEATGNSDAIVALLAPRVARVVVSNPLKTRAIAEAKVKTRWTRGSWRSCSRRISCHRCGCPTSARVGCAARSCAARRWCGSARASRTKCTRFLLLV